MLDLFHFLRLLNFLAHIHLHHCRVKSQRYSTRKRKNSEQNIDVVSIEYFMQPLIHLFHIHILTNRQRFYKKHGVTQFYRIRILTPAYVYHLLKLRRDKTTLRHYGNRIRGWCKYLKLIRNIYLRKMLQVPCLLHSLLLIM